MTAREYLQVVAMEECDEMSQRLSKMLRFGEHEVQPGQRLDNRERFFDEVNDFVAALKMLGYNIHDIVDPTKVDAKMAKVAHFMEYSRRQGVL